jgi:hypothetical protein
MLIAAEDRLSAEVIRRLLRDSAVENANLTWLQQRGQTYLKSRMPQLIRSAMGGLRVLVCTDLDMRACVGVLRADWVPNGVPDLLLFAVAIREVEAWIIADTRLRSFLKTGAEVPQNPEALQDPKAAVLTLARTSRSRKIRDDIAPSTGAIARVGPGYNDLLSVFVRDVWDHEVAAAACTSLSRLKRKLEGWLRTD